MRTILAILLGAVMAFAVAVEVLADHKPYPRPGEMEWKGHETIFIRVFVFKNEDDWTLKCTVLNARYDLPEMCMDEKANEIYYCLIVKSDPPTLDCTGETLKGDPT